MAERNPLIGRLMAMAALLPLAAKAQTPFAFTDPNTGAAASSGSGISLSQMLAQGAIKQDIVVPDAFKQPADGTDDAPSLQRAITAICAGGRSGTRLDFYPRHYSMQSPVTQPCQVRWRGQGWEDQQNTTQAAEGGTWLDFAAGAFGVSGTTNSVTINGIAASGSTVDGIAVTSPVALPASDATSWTPNNDPAIFETNNINGGVWFNHILCYGVNQCIFSYLSGRSRFTDIRGQAWRGLIVQDLSLDSSKFDDIHEFPYFTSEASNATTAQAALMIAFTQSGGAGIQLYRSDTPQIGRVFFFGLNAGVDIEETSNTSYPGTASGVTIDSLSCDFTRHCLYIGNGTINPTVKIGSLRSYAQAWSSVTNPPTELAASDMIDVESAIGAVVQVGQAEDYGSDSAVVHLNGTSSPAYVQIGSLVFDASRMSANSNLAYMAPGPAHQVGIAQQPIPLGALPTGFAYSNSGTSGILSWPTPVSH